MGYSNNKWRKILTILMIINLCFILFARFTKVFGASNDTIVNIDNNDYTINIDYIVKDYKYYMLVWGKDRNNLTHIDLICSNTEMTFTNNSINRISGGSGDLYGFHCQTWNSFNSCVNYFNSTNFDINNGNGYYYANDNNHSISQYITTGTYINNASICLANYDVKNSSGDIVFNNNVVSYPYFDNVTEIENGYPDGVLISRGDFSENDNLYFHLLKVNSESVPTPGNSVFYYSDNVFLLNKNSSYYKTWDADTNNNYSYYYIPRYKLSLDTNSSYVYVLSSSSELINNSYNHIEEDISKRYL